MLWHIFRDFICGLLCIVLHVCLCVICKEICAWNSIVLFCKVVICKEICAWYSIVLLCKVECKGTIKVSQFIFQKVWYLLICIETPDIIIIFFTLQWSEQRWKLFTPLIMIIQSTLSFHIWTTKKSENFVHFLHLYSSTNWTI